MSDRKIIYLDDAIDALVKLTHLSWENLKIIHPMLDVIEELPSAQPEIIRCKDCKHWLPHEQFGYDEDNEEYHDYCAKLVPEDEYYAFRRHADEWCNRAERRKE